MAAARSYMAAAELPSCKAQRSRIITVGLHPAVFAF